MFLTIYMYQFGWLPERGGNFLHLLQKEGVPIEKEGVPTLEETMTVFTSGNKSLCCNVYDITDF